MVLQGDCPEEYEGLLDTTRRTANTFLDKVTRRHAVTCVFKSQFDLFPRKEHSNSNTICNFSMCV